MNKKKILIAGIIASIIAVLAAIFVQSAANATGDNEPCVPSEAWTETIEHPAVTHVVHHEAVTHVVHHDAVTHEETVIDQEYIAPVWANFQPNNQHSPFVGPAVYPTDARGSWNVHNQIPGGHEGPNGVYFKGNPAKGGNWFYRNAGQEELSHVIVVVDEEAYDETVVDQEAYDETVVDEQAWTETIEHPAVTCEGEQPDPLVQEASSTSYHCGDDTQTTTHTITTTEYVLVEGEWVLGEPVTETNTTTESVEVVPCDTPEEPEEPQEPEEPNTPVHHVVKHVNVTVPTVIDAGL